MPKPALIDRYNRLADEWDRRGYPGLRITSLDRSIQRQRELYLHRGEPGWPKVVAPPGRSAHNFGAGVDVAVPVGYVNRLARIARSVGLETLGGLAGADDPGHLQLPTTLWGSR